VTGEARTPTDRLQLAAVVDRLIYGQDTTFDAEDARTLDRLLPEEARVGFLSRFLHLTVKAGMSGSTQGYAAGVGNVRIPDDKSARRSSSVARQVGCGSQLRQPPSGGGRSWPSCVV
jgi:hypothetical protein